jgi:hypothetical protein
MSKEEIVEYWKDNSRKKLIVIAIALVVVICLAFLVFSMQSPIQPSDNNATGAETTAELEPPLKEEQLRTKGIDRSSYNFPEISGYDYFRQLPGPPLDFLEYKIMYEQGRITDIFRIPEEYYLQPEFIISWPNWINRYKQIEQNIGTLGTGFYQAEQWIYDLKAGETVEASTLLFAGSKIQYYQGISLDYSNKENFNVKIIPEETILGRTYPEFERNPDWIQPIRFIITAKPEIKPGQYMIDFYFKEISNENKEKWREKYRLLFIDRSRSIIEVPINLRFYIGIAEGEEQ